MKKSAILCALVFLGACNQSPQVDWDSEIESLRQANDAYNETGAALDLEKWTSTYAENAKVYPPNSSPVEGVENIKVMGQEFMSMENFQAKFDLREIDISDDATLGFTSCYYTLSFMANGESVSETGTDFHVWKKQEDGSWKIVVDIWNSDQPLPEPEPMAEMDSVSTQ